MSVKKVTDGKKWDVVRDFADYESANLVKCTLQGENPKHDFKIHRVNERFVIKRREGGE